MTRMKKLLLTKESSLDAAVTVSFQKWMAYLHLKNTLHTEGSVDMIVSLYSGFRKISIKQLVARQGAVTCGGCCTGKNVIGLFKCDN